MTSPLETRLGHDLRHLAASQPFTPDVEAIRLRARQRHRRGLAVRAATAAGATVLAFGGLFAAVHVTGRTAVAAGSGTSVSKAPRIQTVGYVTKQVTAALANVNNYINYSQSTDKGLAATMPGLDVYTAENWVDPRTNNDFLVLVDSNGKSISWNSSYLVNRVLTWKNVEADFSTGTWFVSVTHAAGPIQGSTAGVTSFAGPTPQEIKAWFDSGDAKLLGTQEVNGHQAIGLRLPLGKAGYRELWVDAKTYLPLRTIVKFPGRPLGVGNETWLPRTKALVDMVNHINIPAGFKQVPPPQ